MARRRPRKRIRLRNLVIGTGTNPTTVLIVENDTTETDVVIGLMSGIIRMIASTIAILHAKTARIATEMTNLVATTKATPRPRKPRIARVAIMLTMLKQAPRDALILALALAALTVPPRKSKGLECHPPHEHSHIVPLPVILKKTTALTRETRPPMLVPRNQANGKGSPRLLLQRLVSCSCLRGEQQ